MAQTMNKNDAIAACAADEAVLTERGACAALAERLSMKHADCDYCGPTDPETGEMPCSRHDGCRCDDLFEMGQEISKAILKR